MPDQLVHVLGDYSGSSVVEDTFIEYSGKDCKLKTFDTFPFIIDLTKEFRESGWGLKVPFAYDPGGWHFCLSFDEDARGKVFVNRWTDHAPEEQFVVIANSFEEFIEGLGPRREDGA